MHGLFAAGVETVAAAVILIPVLLLMGKLWIRNGWRTLVHILFTIYLAAVYTLVGLPTAAYIRLDLTVNLVPFMGMVEDWKNSILNVALFVPLGIFLPMLSVQFLRLKYMVLCSLGITTTIEMLQMFTFRATDVNDLITNVAGAVIGYWMIMVPLQKVRQAVVPCENTWKIYADFGIVFTTMFLFQPLIAGLLWNVVLG